MQMLKNKLSRYIFSEPDPNAALGGEETEMLFSPLPTTVCLWIAFTEYLPFKIWDGNADVWSSGVPVPHEYISVWWRYPRAPTFPGHSSGPRLHPEDG